MRLEARKYLMTSTKLQIPACLWFLSGAGATGNTVTGGAKPCSSTSASWATWWTAPTASVSSLNSGQTSRPSLISLQPSSGRAPPCETPTTAADK